MTRTALLLLLLFSFFKVTINYPRLTRVLCGGVVGRDALFSLDGRSIEGAPCSLFGGAPRTAVFVASLLGSWNDLPHGRLVP
jgi:hypothetical protein